MPFQRIYVGLTAKLLFVKKIIFSVLVLLFSFNAFSQSIPDSLVVNVSNIINSASIEKNTMLFFDTATAFPHTALESIPSKTFVPLLSYKSRKSIPDRFVTKPLYLCFKLINTGQKAASLYFFPGLLYENIELYRSDDGVLRKIEYQNRQSGLIHFRILPGDVSTYVVKLGFCKTTLNNINAELVNESFLPYYKMNIDKTLNDKKTTGLVLSGILLMMVLFTIVNFFITRRIEFLYNCLYTFCMFLLIFFSAYLSKSTGSFKLFFIAYFDLFLLIIGTIFYLAFTREFLNTKTVHPKLNKFLIIEEWVLLILMGIFTILYYFTDEFVWQMQFENWMKIFIIAAAIVYIIVSLVEKDRLMNYLAIGTAAQILFSIISFILILLKVSTEYLLTAPVFYFEIGVIVSVVFFLLGLSYKNRQEIIEKVKEQEAMKLEVEKKGFETQLAVINAQQEERNRISADMHDDLGAGMTTIRLYSELAKNKIGDNVIPEIEKISSSASELIDKMNAIIWSMSSSNDSLGNMIAYIRSYAQEYFEDFPGIKCKIHIPEILQERQVNGEIRRNVFLVVKEALHNIVKHSSATEVNIILKQESKGLSLSIHDNGKGINLEDVRFFGNGLKNMKKRMDAVNFDFSIENHNGTTIKLYRQTLD